MARFTSSSVYKPYLLSIYDLYVLRFSCRFAWRCPKSNILKLYEYFASDKHLEAGVGSGYFLDKYHWHNQTPDLTTFDINPNCLSFSAKRIKRFKPKMVEGDLMQPINLPKHSFKSISLNYVLHCIQGDLKQKAVIFDHLKELLAPSGVIFGATILNVGVQHNFLSRSLEKIYNKEGIFGNAQDSLQDLKTVLNNRFSDVDIKVIGAVALFSARNNV